MVHPYLLCSSGDGVLYVYSRLSILFPLFFLYFRRESLRIQRTSYLRSFNLSFFFIAGKLVAFTTFTVYGALGNPLLTKIVFIAVPMFDILRLTVTLFIPYCIMHCLEGLVSVKRVKVPRIQSSYNF